MVCLGTKQVARLLNVNISSLTRAVWEDRITAPSKGPGGAFLWGPEDIQRASWVMRRKSADDVLSELDATTQI